MGLTTRAWLAAKRLYFWGAFLGIAFLFSPDPTGMAPILVAGTMIGLFEATLFVLRWVRRSA
jgi:sec-independent protein translocase protein TatC